MRKNSTALIVAAATAAFATVFGCGASQVNAQTAANSPVFDWSVVDNTGNAAFTPAPFLTDSSAASVKQFLMKEYKKDPNAVLAVKVSTSISNATAALVFGSNSNPVPYSVKYVFADIETGSNAQDVQATAALVSQIRAVGSNSRSAFIGEFGIAAGTDGTAGSSSTAGTPNYQTAPGSSFNFSSNDYQNAHVNMSNEGAYPGSPSFASLPSQFPKNDAPPDIRSALFVLPIERVGFATIGASGNSNNSFVNSDVGAGPKISAGGYQNIPWIARFDNYGNNSLNTNPGYMGYKYVFHQTGQMLSSNDFSAQVLQYELRGATSFNLFNYTEGNDPVNGNATNSSVIGYSVKQEQTAALAGWNYGQNDPTLNGILTGNKYSFANMVNKVPGPTAGKSISSIATGMMLSGVYSKNSMTLLLSNMSETQNKVDFWQKIGGASINLTGANKLNAKSQTTQIAPGTHELLDFTLQGGQWVLTNPGSGFSDGIYGTSIFATGSGSGAMSRDAFGVPEPASLGLLGLAALGLVTRRRRSV